MRFFKTKISLSAQISPPSRFFAVSRSVLVTFSDILARMRRAEIWVRWTVAPSAFGDFNENPLKHAISRTCVHAQDGDIDCRNAIPRCLYFNARASTPPSSNANVSPDSSGWGSSWPRRAPRVTRLTLWQLKATQPCRASCEWLC